MSEIERTWAEVKAVHAEALAAKDAQIAALLTALEPLGVRRATLEERVARALWLNVYPDLPWESHRRNEQIKDNYRGHARAAIAAVREHEARAAEKERVADEKASQLAAEAMLEEMARAIALANDEQIDWDYCRSVPDHPLVDRAMRQARAAKSVGDLKYTGAATVLSVPAAELIATKAAEAMRDRCEAIARDECKENFFFEGTFASGRIMRAIAALRAPVSEDAPITQADVDAAMAGNANLQAEIERLTKANKQLTVDLESTRGEIARHTALFRQKEAECERLQLAAAPTRLKRRPAPKRKPAVRRPKAVKGSRR